jgi:hypothetical protein
MHTDSSTVDAVAQDDATDQAIMGLLLIDHPGLWSVGEVAREMGDELRAQDGLARLAGAGLIHRLDGFVFATRAAARACVLTG